MLKNVLLIILLFSANAFSIETININNITFKKINDESIVLYAEIQNLSDKVEYLLDVEAKGFSEGKIQKTVHEDNVARVIKIDRLAIPANSTIFLKPKGVYILINNLPKSPSIFKDIKIKFKFANFAIIEDLPAF